MKFNKIVIGTLMLGLTSCSDVLDKGPLDAYSEKEVWSSPELVQSFIYPALSSGVSYLIDTDSWTDNNVINDNSGASSINKEQIDRYFDAGWNIYGTIRKCNLVLEKLSDNTTFTESDKASLIAQAKMIRAMTYYSRARLFGKLMIVDKVVDEKEDMKFPRTTTIKDTYDFIIKDLQDAAPNLPVSDESKQGILTQGAAYALLAEVALQGAAYIESGQKEYYQIAKSASESLLSLGRYSLDTDYEKLFNSYDYALNSKEIILALWRSEDNTSFSGTWMQSLVPNINNDKMKKMAGPTLNDSFEGWPTMFPSEDLAEAYEAIDLDGTAKDWDQTTYYKDWKEKGGYVSDAIYKHRDKRFAQTIVYDSTKYFNSIITTRMNGNLNWDSKAGGNWGMTTSGYLYRKGVYTDNPLWYSDPTNYHYIVLRLGRSYLNYAEALLRLGQTAKAIEYINKTRTAHGGLPSLSTSLSSEEAWKAYKRERRIELVQESDRYWSLLRWNKADGHSTIDELNITQHAIKISEDGKNFWVIALPYYRSDNEHVFTSKRYLFPVPEGERTENSNLDQNEGW